MRRARALVFVLVVGLAGCGGSGSNLSRTEATERVRALIDATAQAVADDLTVTPQPDALLPMGCTNNAGKVLDTIEVSYRVELTLKPETDVPDLLERTQSYWEADGYDVGEVEVPNSSRPRFFADRDGYRFSFQVQKDLRRALLGGTTPCVKTAS